MGTTLQSDFVYHLQQGHYQSALDLGKELEVDTDVVYKAQWQARFVNGGGMWPSASDVALLDKIHDDAFVVGYALDLTAAQPDVQQQLLQVGLARAQQQTEALLKAGDNKSEWTDTQKTWLRARFYLLDHLDRLQTWQSIHGSSDDFGSFAAFRYADLVLQAVSYAQAEDRRALDALFLRHGKQLLPYRLAILAQIPETVDPASFDLPHVSGDHEDLWDQQPWRDEDPVDAFSDVLALPVDLPYKTTPYPATAAVIRQWYLERILTIDNIGLSSHALGLARFAAAMGVPALHPLIERYEWLCKYVYAAARPEDAFMQLDDFTSLSPFDVMEGFLTRTTLNSVVQDMRRLVLPWLDYCSRHLQPDDDDDDEDDEPLVFLLYRWLLEQAPDHLDWACAVLEASKPTFSLDERIVRDDADLSRLVLAMVYASDGAMADLVRMFECLPIFDELDENDDEGAPDMASLVAVAGTPLGLFTALQEVGKSGLTTMMDTLQWHLTAAEVLARYHASVPLQWYLSDHPQSEQRQLCIKMAAQAAGGVESGGAQFDQDDDWRELLDDMLRLHDNGNGIFGKVDEKDIVDIFYTTLLRSARFQLARQLLAGSRPLLDHEHAEQLVIEAEQEFFDNSMNGNMKTGNMKKAWDCLHVVPPTPRVQQELDLIEATHMLISVYQVSDKPGMRLMPIQLRQSTDRLDLISKLVNTRKGIYRQFKEVLQLTGKLGYKDDPLAEVTVLAMMAGAAMVDEEYGTCYRLCQAAIEKAQAVTTSKHHDQAYVDKVHQAAWQICFNLGKLQAYDDPWRRIDALAMALTVCPIEYTHDILAVHRSLEQAHPITHCDPSIMLQLEHGRFDDPLAEASHPRTHASWQGLLQSAKKGQSMLGGLIKGAATDQYAANPHAAPSPPPSSTSGMQDTQARRKRDQLRQIVGGVGDWLFHQP
ncbi:secretory pathway protein Sec39-domain-containing protein [Gongronella butleri]|nr:secretory pathway protein Sec39-domain-containing protein [Gongronella butleri]